MFALVLIVIGLWAGSKFINAVCSSLNNVPSAHFTAPWSGLWILWARATGKEFSVRLTAHRKLGPIVRLGPQELSIDCLEEGVRTVYGRSWDKTSMYNMFANYGVLPLFALAGSKEHTERKRILGNIFSKSTIRSSVEFRRILDVIGRDRLQPRLQQMAETGLAPDMFSLTREYSMDVVAAYIYGLDAGTDWLNNPKEAMRYLSAFRDTGRAWEVFANGEFPQLVRILHIIGLDIISSSFYESLNMLQTFVFDLTAHALATQQIDEICRNVPPIRQVWKRLGDMSEAQKTCLLASEAFDQVHAGHESTGIALTFLMWELSRNDAIQNELRRQLRSFREAGNPPEDCQLLDDIVTETMRLYPAAGGPFTRVAPEYARLAGFDIPAGTVVSAIPYTLGRKLEVFYDPESWIPERWSAVDAEEKKRMKEWVWAFLSGSRICIAEYLAIRVMKAFVIEVYSDYKTTITSTSNMNQLETWFAVPADSALHLSVEAC